MFSFEDLHRAWQARSALRSRLIQEGTDCYRLLHGATEGFPGLTVDVYGSLLLLQCHREPLQELEPIWSALAELGLTGMVVWWRASQSSTVLFQRGDCQPRWVKELGLEYYLEALPRRLDPQLFLDTRVIRRYLLGNRRPRSVLNLFAYTGSLGIAAGGSELWQVDFSRSALDIAARNGERNGCQQTRLICQEVYPTLWQLAGRPIRRRPAPGRRLEPLAKRTFDLILLDPPQRSKGYYGSVDIKNDYPALLRPCLEFLGPGGELILTNNLAGVGEGEFISLLERCARKAGREWRELQVLVPEEDFPSPDGRPPLKIVVLRY